MTDRYIDIVFDGPPSAVTGRFVEVEDETGASVSFGQWVDREDGTWALRLPGLKGIPSASKEGQGATANWIQSMMDAAAPILQREGIGLFQSQGYLLPKSMGGERDDECASDGYYCAERDSRGDIRLNCGRGLLVATAKHTRADVQRWFDRAVSDSYREQYRAALALFDREESPKESNG